MTEAFLNRVADWLGAFGLTAYVNQTGGGICCIEVEVERGSYTWGTADETWAAQFEPEDDCDQRPETLTTALASDCKNPTLVARAISDAMEPHLSMPGFRAGRS